MTSKPTLGYWPIRGLAQPIRCLLEHLNVDYENKEVGRDGWFAEKFNLGFDFPNLPYYIEGDLKMTQSTAILKHIARQHGLVPTDPKVLAMVEVIEGSIIDYRSKFVGLCYNPQWNSLKDDFRTAYMPVQNDLFQKFLEGKKWLAGDQLTYVDFLLYELLIQLNTFDSSLFSTYSNLKNFCSEFRKLNGIKQCETKYATHTMNGGSAQFNGAVSIPEGL